MSRIRLFLPITPLLYFKHEEKKLHGVQSNSLTVSFEQRSAFRTLDSDLYRLSEAAVWEVISVEQYHLSAASALNLSFPVQLHPYYNIEGLSVSWRSNWTDGYICECFTAQLVVGWTDLMCLKGLRKSIFRVFFLRFWRQSSEWRGLRSTTTPLDVSESYTLEL